jgi:hypothetical protein
MKLLVNNFIDLYSSISTNDEDQYNPVTNIAVKTLADYWQTSSTGLKEVSITLDTAVTVKEIALAYHNIMAGDTVVFSSYPDASGFAGTPISVNMTVRDGIIYLNTNNLHTNTRYYKLSVTKNSGSYLRIGFLFIGDCNFFAVHKAYKLPNNKNNFSISPSSGWQVYTNSGQAVSVYSFECIADAENYAKAMTLDREYIGAPGICLPTHENLDAKEPFFGYLEASAFDREYSGWYFINMKIVEAK